MARDYSISIDGHPNIYDNYSPRKLNIYFSEPNVGVTQETGLVLFIPGFGGNANSNIYKKMRSVFADKYNMVTVQCDYFGWEFMQSEPTNETLSNFNDMGIMQVLDNITAITLVAEIIKDNELTFNTRKIIAYGHSHGAYLAYLCNIFAPNLLSLIIDNSAWLFPVYLEANRQLFINGNSIIFNYLAKTIVDDKEILHLPTRYKKANTKCLIHSFHGVNDNLITIKEKRSFCLPLKRCFLHEITPELVDQEMFKSSSHGLDADFLLLFDHVLNNLNIKFNFNDKISINNHRIETKKYSYQLDYTNHIPVMKVNAK